METRIIGLMILLVAFPVLGADSNNVPLYLGQEPPGFVPKVFAPGLISLPGRGEGFICFTQDLRECYFNACPSSGRNQVMVARYENGQWTVSVPAPFLGDENSYATTLADHDQSLYFVRGNFTICRIRRTRTASGAWSPWSPPEVLPAPVNRFPSGPKNENVCCHISSLGNMWICSWRPGGLKACDLWRFSVSDGRFTDPVNLRVLNSAAEDCTAVTGPDEKYVVLRSNRPGGFGKEDLYVSFAEGKGGWTAPKNLGPAINTSGCEDAPTLSPDHKYLFFSRTVSRHSDIYWVSVGAFLPDPNGPVLNVTTGKRFACIQTAVNYAQSGQVIQVSPGTYQENLILPNLVLTIRSANAQDPAVVAATTLAGDKESPMVKLLPGVCVRTLQGLTITGGADGALESGPQLQLTACVVQ